MPHFNANGTLIPPVASRSSNSDADGSSGGKGRNQSKNKEKDLKLLSALLSGFDHLETKKFATKLKSDLETLKSAILTQNQKLQEETSRMNYSSEVIKSLINAMPQMVNQP